MPSNDSFEYDYVPTYTKPTHEYGQSFGDEFHAEAVQELLLSMAGYTQRGVTLAPGQGVLPTGTVLSRATASGYYYAYNSGGTTDGRQTPIGVLRDSRDTGGTGYASVAAYNAATGLSINASGAVQSFPASPAGKVATPALGNILFRGILNASLVSGTDTASLVSGTQGLASTTLTALGARVTQFGGGVGSNIPFPGSPMDGVPVSGTPAGVNAFIF
jgi:hypothetical protein